MTLCGISDIVVAPYSEKWDSFRLQQEIIEKIDIGGISLIRAAAKNFNDVVIIPSKDFYEDILSILKNNDGVTTIQQRRHFATAAFMTSSHYDTAIFNYFNKIEVFEAFAMNESGKRELRYGENPHQKAAFFGSENNFPKQLHGKEISYNNLLDIEAAIELISDFEDTAVAIIKHNNACGCAVRSTLLEAWTDALAADPVSAFGGIIVTNRKVDLATAEEIGKIFFEVIIAPDYEEEALEILKKKKNRIILVSDGVTPSQTKFRSVFSGVLVQERDSKKESPEELKSVTIKTPTASETEDMLFANILVKHSKSNAIVLAKNKSLVASGIGQTSRVDALKQAIEKAGNFNLDLHGAVMASDAFFPFPDCVEIAHNSGITAVIHPGGSIRDGESVDYCNEHDMAMIMTGFRHFKH